MSLIRRLAGANGLLKWSKISKSKEDRRIQEFSELMKRIICYAVTWRNVGGLIKDTATNEGGIRFHWTLSDQ